MTGPFSAEASANPESPQSIRSRPDSADSRISFDNNQIELTVIFACLGLLISTTQILGESPDYTFYTDFFDFVRLEDIYSINLTRFEPGFSVLVYVLTAIISNNTIAYGALVFGVMLIKCWVLNAYSLRQDIFIAVMVFYFFRFFPLHELTQLRVAVAIAFLLAGATFVWNGDKLYGVLACIIAAFFHMSSLILVPALFFDVSKRRDLALIAAVLFITIHVLSGPLTNYLINFIAIIDSYNIYGYGDIAPNLLAVELLIDWAAIAASMVVWDRLSLLMRRIIYLELVSMALFYGLIEYPVIAFRVRELYSVFWVLFVADGLNRRNLQLLCLCFVTSSVILYSYLYIFSGKFFL